MTFRVQRYEPSRRKWVELQFGRREHPTADLAWDQARGYDQDGFLTPEYRVVDQDGKAVTRPIGGFC